MMFNALKRALGIAVITVMAAACVSTSMPEGSGPAHFYYAAVADYVQAKRVAAKYAGEIMTPDEDVEKILDVMEETDAHVYAFDQIRRGNCEAPEVIEVLPALALACDLSDADYSTSAASLRVASSVLRRFALEDE
jgi:hypothetical protein